MDVVLVMFKGDDRREFTLDDGDTIVGRRQDCPLRVQTGDVSRQHCQLTVGPAGLKIKDLDSANGTYVNGERVTEKKLHAGDRLKVGPAVFIVQIDGEPADIRPEDTQVDLVDLDGADAPTVASTPKAAVGIPDDDEDGDDEIVLSEDDLFETADEDFDLDDPISAVDDILDDDEDDDV